MQNAISPPPEKLPIRLSNFLDFRFLLTGFHNTKMLPPTNKALKIFGGLSAINAFECRICQSGKCKIKECIGASNGGGWILTGESTAGGLLYPYQLVQIHLPTPESVCINPEKMEM